MYLMDIFFLLFFFFLFFNFYLFFFFSFGSDMVKVEQDPLPMHIPTHTSTFKKMGYCNKRWDDPIIPSEEGHLSMHKWLQ